MPTPELGPETVKLIDRMVGPPPSHSRFVGEPIDWTQIDALAMGDLWAIAWTTDLSWARNGRIESLASQTARTVIEHGRRVMPVFRGPACRDYLELIARNVEDEPPRTDSFLATDPWSKACFALSRCIDLSFDGLAAAARRILAAADWLAMPDAAMVLARLVGSEFAAEALKKLSIDLAHSPLLVDELHAAAGLDLRWNIMMAAARHPYRFWAEMTEEPHDPLSGEPGYIAYAEAGLKRAVERVRKIHDFQTPYAADKAFSLKESEVIARLARVGLERDEAWVAPLLDELFRKVSLAPTAAKSVPSQSVAIALGHAVAAFPTPEAVETMRAVLRDIRHAGVKKKLQRDLRNAELGLADRPEIALRLPVDQPPSKSRLSTLTRSLQASLALGTEHQYGDWCERLAENRHLRSLTGALVWSVFDAAGGAASVLPVTKQGRLTLQDATGAAVAADPACRVRLWHPAEATAEERSAWGDRLAALQIKQPFKQVFREHYAVPAHELSQTKSAIFAGHVVVITPFLGLARRERWELEYDSLSRPFGKWWASLELADPIYPGCAGSTTVGKLSVSTSAGRKASPLRLGDIPVATFSEIARAVDLLVSVSGFAISAEGEDREREFRLWDLAERPIGAMADMRKEALARVLAGREDMAGLTFDSRHLRLGPYAIHLATGRVTRDGEPVTIDLPARSNLAAVPWLPYDEKLLESIVYAAVEIAQRLKSHTIL